MRTEATEGRNLSSSNSTKCSWNRRMAQREQRLRICGLRPCFDVDVAVVVLEVVGYDVIAVDAAVVV